MEINTSLGNIILQKTENKIFKFLHLNIEIHYLRFYV